MQFQDLTGCFYNILAFIAIQPAPLDLPGQLFRGQCRKVPWSVVLFEQGAGNPVYLLVRTLSGQNHSYQEFERAVEI
jgi:hypothetical protein